jgi:N-acetylglutamate synthase-like GNAT family acetyltransferase
MERTKYKVARQGIILDNITKGNKSIKDIYDEIQKDKEFCRNQESIDRNYLLSLVQSDIVLYAVIEDKLAGVLCFMFNVKPDGERILNLNGICSPKKYAGNKVGETLINTLISIAEISNIQGIYLDCKGRVKEYYENFGFDKINERTIYDSDDSDDEGEPHYFMKLTLNNNMQNNETNIPDLSSMSVKGGKRKIKTLNKIKTINKVKTMKKIKTLKQIYAKTKKSHKSKRKFRK